MKKMIWLVLVVIVIIFLGAVFVLSQKGSSNDTDSKSEEISSEGEENGQGENYSAEQLLSELKTNFDTVSATIAFTSETDPNSLLGRPGGYVGKASFVDTRIDTSNSGTYIDVSDGGSIEVYSDKDGAVERDEYLATFDGTMVGSDYHYVYGNVVVRISKELTPEQAKEYSDFVKNLIDE